MLQYNFAKLDKKIWIKFDKEFWQVHIFWFVEIIHRNENAVINAYTKRQILDIYISINGSNHNEFSLV